MGSGGQTLRGAAPTATEMLLLRAERERVDGEKPPIERFFQPLCLRLRAKKAVKLLQTIKEREAWASLGPIKSIPAEPLAVTSS